MVPEIQITCRGFSRTDAIAAEVERHTAKLTKVFNRIQRVDVTVDLRHRHQRQGNIFHVQIHLHLPRQDVFANREPEKNPAHADLSVAIRDAFAAARKGLEHEVENRRGFTRDEAEKLSVARDEDDDYVEMPA